MKIGSVYMGGHKFFMFYVYDSLCTCTGERNVLLKLNSKVLLPGELLIQFRTDIELLCARLDMKMSKQKLCSHILKGLNPALL